MFLLVLISLHCTGEVLSHRRRHWLKLLCGLQKRYDQNSFWTNRPKSILFLIYRHFRSQIGKMSFNSRWVDKKMYMFFWIKRSYILSTIRMTFHILSGGQGGDWENQITGPYTRWDLVLRVILDYEQFITIYTLNKLSEYFYSFNVEKIFSKHKLFLVIIRLIYFQLHLYYDSLLFYYYITLNITLRYCFM